MENMLDAVDLVKAITSLLVSAVTFILICSLFYSCKWQSKSSKQPLLYLAIWFIASHCCFFGIRAINVFIYDDWDHTLKSTGGYVIAIVYTIVGVCIIASLGFFFAVQLYYTFKDSVYAASIKLLYFHGSLIAVFTTSMLIGVIIYFFHDTSSGRIVMVISIALMSFSLIHMTYLFNRKLFLLVLSQRRTVIQENDITISESQLNILSVIVRITLLISIGIMICVIMLITTFLYGFIDEVRILYELMYALLGISTSFLLFLTLSVNKKYYNILCAKCDKKCRDICTNLAQRSMLNAQKNIENPDL